LSITTLLPQATTHTDSNTIDSLTLVMDSLQATPVQIEKDSVTVP
jgi:hypothetical protein